MQVRALAQQLEATERVREEERERMHAAERLLSADVDRLQQEVAPKP